MARFEKKSRWQERFVALLPVILRYVTPAFHKLGNILHLGSGPSS